MTRDDRETILIYAVMVIVACALAFGEVWCRSSFEAASYERVTGKKVSTWDAVWLDLRVQESTKE